MLTPRYYQQEAVDSIYNYFMNGGKGNPLIALPTASGKSCIPALFIEKAMRRWPHQRFLLLTHVKELIRQNAEKMLEVWANAPLGIYSAGLKRRDVIAPVIYGGIQSMIKIAEAFGHRDIIFVDECFSADTEILTENGFIRFDEIGTQNIAQWDIKTKAIDFCQPLRYIKCAPSSPVLHVHTDRGIDVLATANHDMFATSATGVMHKRKLKDIVSAAYSRLPVAGLGVGTETELSPTEKFTICFQADGNLHRANKDGTAILSFSFKKQRKINAFLKLLEELDVEWKELDTSPHRRFMVYVSEIISKDIAKYFNLVNLNAVKAAAIIEYMNIWDGHVSSKNSYLYTNTDKQAIDFYQAVATLAGFRTSVVKVVDGRSENYSDVYRLSIIKRDTISSQDVIIEPYNYEGDVYCVEMPKGSIVTRRNGKVIITGNCHLISQDEDSQYLRFFAVMKAINPNVKIIGLTATKYRMGQGLLTDDGVFADIIYDMTTLDGYNKLLNEGYLSPLIAPSRLSVSLDISNVGMQRGEFIQGQLQHEVDKAEITWKLLQEAAYFGQSRCSWLIFASGIEHSDHIAEMLNKLGIECASVHSKQTAAYNDSALKAHKELKLRAIVSYSKLTTGLDHPAVDMLIDGRPTMSVPLHVQKYGRGGRLSPATGKQNCLVLDYARNTARLGPVNDPVIPRKKGDKQGEIPIKICASCGVYNHISARECSSCNEPFEFKVKIVEKASTEALLKQYEAPIIETFDVNHILYNQKQKAGKAPYIIVTYFSGMNSFKEYIFPENNKFKKPFTDWWKMRSPDEVPTTTEDAISKTNQLRQPKRIRVHVNRMLNGKVWPEVLSCEW